MPRLGRCDAVKALKGAGKALGCVITEAQRNVYGLFVAAPQFVGRKRQPAHTDIVAERDARQHTEHTLKVKRR